MGTTAIILAAGRSSRLHPLTLNLPKCLLEVGGRSILGRQVHALREAGIGMITVATGHCGEAIRTTMAEAVTIRAVEDWDTRGNLHTLHQCRSALEGEVAILHGDLLLASVLFNRGVTGAGEIGLLCDLERSIEGTMRIRRRGEDVSDLGPHIPVAEGEGTFVGMARLSAGASLGLRRALENAEPVPAFARALWTDVLPGLRQKGYGLRAVPTEGMAWAEIDTPDDLAAARAVAGDFGG